MFNALKGSGHEQAQCAMHIITARLAQRVLSNSTPCKYLLRVSCPRLWPHKTPFRPSWRLWYRCSSFLKRSTSACDSAKKTRRGLKPTQMGHVVGYCMMYDVNVYSYEYGHIHIYYVYVSNNEMQLFSVDGYYIYICHACIYKYQKYTHCYMYMCCIQDCIIIVCLRCTLYKDHMSMFFHTK